MFCFVFYSLGWQMALNAMILMSQKSDRGRKYFAVVMGNKTQQHSFKVHPKWKMPCGGLDHEQHVRVRRHFVCIAHVRTCGIHSTHPCCHPHIIPPVNTQVALRWRGVRVCRQKLCRWGNALRKCLLHPKDTCGAFWWEPVSVNTTFVCLPWVTWGTFMSTLLCPEVIHPSAFKLHHLLLRMSVLH